MKFAIVSDGSVIIKETPKAFVIDGKIPNVSKEQLMRYEEIIKKYKK